MKFHLNGWQRIGIVLSLGWLGFTAFAVIHNYSATNVFNLFSVKNCEFNEGPFFDWYDQQTGKPISELAYKLAIPLATDPTKKLPRGFVSCDDEAKMIAAQLTSNAIIPSLHLNYELTFAVTLLPILASWLFVYLIVLTIQWIYRGFRKT